MNRARPGLGLLLAAALLVPATAVAPGAAGAAPSATSAALAGPTHDVSVTGDGVETYPAFSPDTARYGITTTGATGGTVTVTASTSDQGGRVRVNGQPLTGGSRTLTGLTAGDEIAVFFEDSAGTARHSFIYLPAGFPLLERVTPDPAAGTLQPGHVLLTLSQWVRPTPPALDYYETAVDLNGVPVYAHRTDNSMDLARQPDGHYSVFRRSTSGDGVDLVILDDAFQPIATRRAVGLRNTDGHDAIVEPDGSVWFMSYEPRNPDGTGPDDAIIQRVEPDGTVGFQWSSEDHAADAVRAIDDYAHVNSFQVMSDGDLLVSFRHFSSVYKIATSERPGVDVGDVVWKLGGRDSDFTFPPGDVGPCAQHTARELPNGHILMFDNGSATFTTAWCVDQTAPAGPPVERVQTRIVEYALDEEAGTASVVRSYERGAGTPGRFFAIFAGSAQPLANGNTMIGWAAETKALASEIDADGDLLWEIRDPRAQFPYFTYRAHKTAVPDVTAPAVSVAAPADGATYIEGQVVASGLGCTDRGGSSLQTCDGPTTLDTSTAGAHTVTFSSRDGAGRTTTVTRHYTVLAGSGVDASVRARGNRAWSGEGTVGPAAAQRVTTKVARPAGRSRVTVRVTNTAAVPGALTLTVAARGSAFKVKPRAGVTTPVLAPGESWELTLKARRTARAEPGDTTLVTVSVLTSQSPTRGDAVSWRVKAVQPRSR